MSDHTITESEARDRFSELIDRARAGEAILISRAGEVVAELKSAKSKIGLPSGHASHRSDWDWLVARRVGTRLPDEDAGTFVGRQRDEEQM